MSAYFLLGILRNLRNNKLHSLINIASLALGLAVFAFAFLYVKKETSYDRSWPHADRIHRLVVEQEGIPGRQDGTSDTVVARVFPALLESFPDQIDKATRLTITSVKNEGDPLTKSKQLALADPAFADIFQLEIVSGNLATALQEPGFVAIEESIVSTFPGTVTVGSRLMLEGGGVSFGRDGKTLPPPKIEYQVAAIFRPPKNTSGADNFQMITMMHDYSKPIFFEGRAPWDDSHKIWLTLKAGVATSKLNTLMPDFVDHVITTYNSQLKPGEHVSERLHFKFQPVTDLHFHPIGFEALGSAVNGNDVGRVLTIAVIGLLVLLVGCSNSISLSLATVLERRREIGIRKAVGALQNDILLHYLGEAVLLALLALVPAIALVHWLLPPFSTLLRISALTPALTDYLLWMLIATLVGLASGAYPALVLSRVKPQLVLKVNNFSGGRGNQSVRSLLVGFQFCFALMLVIATLALYLQLTLVRKQPLGFSADNLVIASMPPDSFGKFMNDTALLEELRKIPGVRYAVTPACCLNSPIPANLNSFKLVNKGQDNIEVAVQQSTADYDNFSMLKIPILAGRVFDPARDARDPQNGKYKDQGEGETSGRLLLNRAAARALGFASPEAAVNQPVYQRYSDQKGKVTDRLAIVLGVVEDSMYQSLRRKPAPEAFSAKSPISISTTTMLKLEDASNLAVQAEIKRVWQQVTGSPLQNMTFVELTLANAFAVEQNESRLLLYCAGLALFLSCIGLYGLAAFTMERRIKEVGVRKVMGASVAAITLLFMWRYARPVLLATLVASPVAVYFVLQWMERFPYQMDKLWLVPLCIAAGTVVLAIALLTVAGIVLKAARAKPVQSLRYE